MTMTETEIDFIYFDLGNVLLNFSHQRACEQVAREANLGVEKVWEVVFETSLVANYELGKISDEQFHAEFCDATGAAVDLNRFLCAFSDIFSLNQSVIPLVVELTQCGFPIGILSNTCNAHWRFAITQFPLLQAYFPNHCVLSFQEASVKPERRIYDAAIQTASRALTSHPAFEINKARSRSVAIEPARIFFVDDRPENVAGAREAGLDAVLFESATQLRRALSERGLRV